jgi:hypothetical protein
MSADKVALLLNIVVVALEDAVHLDWSQPAGTLEWTSWQTVDHLIDCLFSYAFQLAAGAQSGFLRFGELHAQHDAGPADLVTGLRAVGTMFVSVVRQLPPDATASDGLVVMGVSDWCARAGYELALHSHDVASGLGVQLEVPEALCESITSSPTLWMYDRDRASTAADPWTALLVGSGRPAPV